MTETVPKTSLPYLNNAPRSLVMLHMRMHESWNKDLLGTLLCAQEMESAWRTIETRAKSQLITTTKAKPIRPGDPALKPTPFSTAFDEEMSRIQASRPLNTFYERLWDEIQYAKSRSKQTFEAPRNIRNRWMGVARKSRELATAIADGPLDLLVSDYFDEHLTKALYLKNQKRYVKWPAMTKLLEELARHAEQRPEAIQQKRLVHRNTRNTEGEGRQQLNLFVRHMGRYFRTHLNGPLHRALAVITSIVFDCDIDEGQIHQILRRSPR